MPACARRRNTCSARSQSAAVTAIRSSSSEPYQQPNHALFTARWQHPAQPRPPTDETAKRHTRYDNAAQTAESDNGAIAIRLIRFHKQPAQNKCWRLLNGRASSPAEQRHRLLLQRQLRTSFFSNARKQQECNCFICRTRQKKRSLIIIWIVEGQVRAVNILCFSAAMRRERHFDAASFFAVTMRLPPAANNEQFVSCSIFTVTNSHHGRRIQRRFT